MHTTDNAVALHLCRASSADEDISLVQKGDSIPPLGKIKNVVKSILRM